MMHPWKYILLNLVLCIPTTLLINWAWWWFVPKRTKVSIVYTPIDMLLLCPKCHKQHVDASEPETGWTNPPHKQHLCHFCGNMWTPCEMCTNGAKELSNG